MAFSVEITKAALADAEEYVGFLRADHGAPIAAERWWNGLIDQILSLETLPRRCSIIPEQRYFEQEMRHLIYAPHRIIFSIDKNTVTILRIYHGARKPFTRSKETLQSHWVKELPGYLSNLKVRRTGT